MTSQSGFDLEQAHRYFSAHCFNAAWGLLDKPDRSVADNEQMIRLAHASLWHWSQRSECTPRNLSIGYWQVSRIYAVLEQAENAWRYAERCLEVTPPEEPFFLGYAHEALARAASIAGDARRSREHLDEARRHAERIEDQADKSALLADLDSLATG